MGRKRAAEEAATGKSAGKTEETGERRGSRDSRDLQGPQEQREPQEHQGLQGQQALQGSIRLSSDAGRYDFGVVSLSTRKSMQGNKRRDTKPEVKVRQMLREMGFTGYRCDWAKAPGRPDVAFVGRRLAIEVRGCFWHRCPVCQMSVPKKNVEYWEAKFARNLERDERNLAALEELGWRVLVLWEHQLKKKELPATRKLLYDFVRREDDPPYEEAFPEVAE